MIADVLDGAILAFLVFTWFYEGHHKKCEVKFTCPECGAHHDVACGADRRNR